MLFLFMNTTSKMFDQLYPQHFILMGIGKTFVIFLLLLKSIEKLIKLKNVNNFIAYLFYIELIFTHSELRW